MTGEERAARPPGTPDADDHARILIVEDSPTQAVQLRGLLETHGFRIAHAPTAEAALDCLNGHLPHLVIADYHLPGMNGDELVRQLRLSVRTRSLPILILTADNARDSERLGLESGADAYIPKSSDSALLLLRIRALLRQYEVRRDARSTTEPARPFTPFRRGRILVVQGDAARAAELAGLLARDGYAVEQAADADSALDLAAKGAFDCVLVELSASAIDGVALCAQLNRLRGVATAASKPMLNFQITGMDAGGKDEKDLLAATYMAGADDIIPSETGNDVIKLRIRALVRRKLIQEENLRIDAELREQELTLANARAETAAAAAKAAAADSARMVDLLESERRFRTIFDTGFQLIWLLDLEGRIVVANRTALDAAPPTTPLDCVLWDSAWWARTPEESQRLKREFVRAVQKYPVRYEAELKGENDRARIFDLSLRPALDAHGRVSQVVVEAHDVTEFKQTEAALRQSQKMEAIGQLTGGVAHDFNNLLMAILSNLELLRRRLPASDLKIGRLIEGAMQGAQRGAALTQRLLAFARRQELRSQSVDVGQLLRDMENLVERSVGPRVALQWEIPPRLPPAMVDPNQLELAILNLVVNSRDAMPDGGTVQLKVENRSVHPGEADLAPGPYICIRVIDTGAGMDSETLKRAIEPFYSTKEIGKGTGLGLSMVHGLAVQSGGTLRLSSVAGTGTAAELWLPISETPAALRDEATAAPADIAKATILVVDDDALIAMSTVDMIEDLGHTVIEANSGEGALAVLRGDAQVDLMITDYAMPGMTGNELAKAAKALRPDLPILLATGYAELPTGTTIELPRLSKPYDQQQLAQQIAALLDPRRKPVQA
jgi:DNA-binding response OmpR family regulator/nitrogen-specific signal transduction histidine kinase